MTLARTSTLASLAALSLALAACDGGAADETAAPTAETPVAPVPDAGTGSAAPTDAAETVNAIPAAMQGRWGINAADCDPDDLGPKGLMTVDGRTLRFYESVAEIGEATLTGGTALRGTFAYEGEGMQWSRELALMLSGDDTLVLEEFGDDAVPGKRTYRRCN